MKPETHSRTGMRQNYQEKKRRGTKGREWARRRSRRGEREPVRRIASGLLKRENPQPQKVRHLYAMVLGRNNRTGQRDVDGGGSRSWKRRSLCAQSLQSCLTHSHPIGYIARQASLSMEFLQARILERVALLSSTESS